MVTDILTDCAPKTALDCASDRSSLRVATVKVRKDKAAESVPDGQTDIEEHIAAAMARSPVMAERVA